MFMSHAPGQLPSSIPMFLVLMCNLSICLEYCLLEIFPYSSVRPTKTVFKSTTR
jgi:hypothetical protein